MIELPCERFHELAPELALGILPGAERAAAIAHVEACAACRDQLTPLAVIGDDLLDLVPCHEPSSGFETRVLNRMRPGPAPRRHRTGLLVAAMVGIAVVAGFGGSAIESAAQHDTAAQAPAEELRTGTFATAAGRQMGQIVLYTGDPAWVFMTAETDHPTDKIICQVLRTDGSVVRLGEFSVGDGHGHWGTPLGLDPATVSEVRLIATDGTLLATSRPQA